MFKMIGVIEGRKILSGDYCCKYLIYKLFDGIGLVGQKVQEMT